MEFESFVLAASTKKLAEEPTARPHADAIELRLDLAEAPLEQLRTYTGELPVIATNRLTDDGGAADDASARLDQLEAATATDPVAAIDIELATVESGAADPVLAAAHDNDVSVIVSAHDFDATPARDVMRSILRSASREGDVGKLAVTATEVSDVIALLEVTMQSTGNGLQVATMAMGETGRHSRAITPLYGSRIGYAPVASEAATAPGQFELETLRLLVDALGVE